MQRRGRIQRLDYIALWTEPLCLRSRAFKERPCCDWMSVKRECLVLISEGMKGKKGGGIGTEKCLLEFLCYLPLKRLRDGASGNVVIICKGERSGICVQRTIDGGLPSLNSHFG